MRKDISKKRLVDNEEMFKIKNVKAANTLGKILPEDTPISFICECSDESCKDHIDLFPREFRDLHSNPRRYIVRPNHETLEVENVIDETDNYTLVEKHIVSN